MAQTMALILWEVTPELSLVLSACWQAQFGGKVMKRKEKCEEVLWLWPISPTTPVLMPPESSGREGGTLPVGRISMSLCLATDKQALKNSKKWYIHFLILGSNLCFLSKTSFKIQNLLQWDIPNRVFKEAIFIYLRVLLGRKKTLLGL